MLEMLLDHLRRIDPMARRLGLNVNRQNLKAVWFYLRNGFEITSRRDHNIGNGYYMNDYILHRDI
jgi:ribosomal protein S18 acetylase RimI-like enzyme